MKIKCKQCGTTFEVPYKLRRRKFCELKCYWDWRRENYKCSDATKAKVGRGNKGKRRSKEAREKISSTRKRLHREGKITPWNKGLTIADSRVKRNGLAISKTLKEKGLRKGSRNSQYGKLPKPLWGKYRGINMRSEWERIYASYLDMAGIRWRYECTTFKIVSLDTTYTPDFYLVDLDEYHEVKGYLSKNAAEKIKCFRMEYPHVILRMVRKEEMVKAKTLSA